MKEKIIGTALIFFGAIAGIFFFLLFAVLLNGYTIHGGYKFLQDQGGTISALVTAGTIIVVWFVHIREVASQKASMEDRRLRREYTFRAKLGHELHDLIKYASKCFEYIDSDYVGDKPERPKGSIDFLIEGFEDLDKVSYTSLKDLVSECQIQYARVTSDSRSSNRKETDFYDTIRLHAMFLNCFYYARHHTNVLSFDDFSVSDMYSSLNSLMNLEVYSQKYRDLIDVINHNAQHDEKLRHGMIDSN